MKQFLLFVLKFYHKFGFLSIFTAIFFVELIFLILASLKIPLYVQLNNIFSKEKPPFLKSTPKVGLEKSRKTKGYFYYEIKR
jgi:hypothetical protein